MIRYGFFFALLLFSFEISSSFVYAQVTVEFSSEVDLSLGAPSGQKEIQDMINEGLKKMGKKYPGALALFNSKQKIKVLCYGEKKAKELGVKKPEAEMFTQSWGETIGDFNKDGSPKKGGTAYIVVDCDYFLKYRWYAKFEFFKVKQSMWDILVHELLHATHHDRQHAEGKDSLEMYQKWVSAFNASIKKLYKKTVKLDKERGYLRLSKEWMDKFKAALAEEFRKQQAKQKTDQSGKSGGSTKQGQGSEDKSGTKDSDSSSSSTDKRTSQSTTIPGTYQTKSGTELAGTKANLPTVVTGTWFNSFFSAESFLAGFTEGGQHIWSQGDWNQGDSVPSFAHAVSGNNRLLDLQITIEVRFITLQDNFFDRIGVDFDFDITDQNLSSTTPKNEIVTAAPDSGSISVIDGRFISIDDKFINRIGVEFDAALRNQGDSAVGSKGPEEVSLEVLNQFYQDIGGHHYGFGVSHGYDTGFVDVPFITIVGKQQVEVGNIVVNDNPNKIFGLNSDVSPWRIVEETQGVNLPLDGWTHASLPFGTTLGWQPDGDAGTLDAFTRELGSHIRYQEPNAGVSGAPAPLDPNEWPQTSTHPTAHTKIKKVW